jgi:hypothetical protein
MPDTVMDKQTHPSSNEMNLDLLGTVLFLDLGADLVIRALQGN